MEKRSISSGKKAFGILLSFFLLLMVFSFVQAQDEEEINDETDEPTEEQQIDDAYLCLEEKVEGRCASLSRDEKIFSLLAINQCEEELMDESFPSGGGECWPSGGCTLETTAKAVLALDHAGTNTEDAQQWLTEKTGPTENLLDWYIQVDQLESSEEMSCSINYMGSPYTFVVNEDKTIESEGLGSGLEIESEGYWLEVKSNFYNTDFIISCDKGFRTNLLFRDAESPETVHVFPEFNTASADGSTTERVESSCFEQNGICNYEGTLWSAFVLNRFGEDISSYLPYIITFEDDHSDLLPEMFLYSITSGMTETIYKDSLLSKQIGDQWWQTPEDRYYATALALYPFQGETFTEKTSTKNWLLDDQETDGCWAGGNIRNTAFILESLWPRDFVGAPDPYDSDNGVDSVDCEAQGNYCVSSGECEGDILDQSCPGSHAPVCCTEPPKEQTCSDLIAESGGGKICSSGESCQGGLRSTSVDGLDHGEVCCYGASAYCKLIDEEDIEDTDDIEDKEDVEDEEETSLLWIWILLALIIIVTIGIIFKDKLREFWLKIKSKSRGSKSREGRGYPGPGRPPGRPGPPPHYPRPRRPSSERRIMPRPHQKPSHSRAPSRPKPKSGGSNELDDVLKKLKDMSS